MRRAPQAARVAGEVVAVADSAVLAGAVIGAAVAAVVVAGDAEIAGNHQSRLTTRAVGPVGMPRVFYWPPFRKTSSLNRKRRLREEGNCSGSQRRAIEKIYGSRAN
jgi:hypothetical protein